MKSITEAGDLKGKKVIVRVDWNEPVENYRVLSDYRIKKSFPTIEYLEKAGAKVILISHREGEENSLEPAFKHAKTFLPNLTFKEDGPIMLLENLRQNSGEMANSLDYAKELSGLGEIYVNEAFSESHRNYASIVGIPKFLPSYAGLRLSIEVQELSKTFYPKHPFLFILGGAKFDTKLPLVKKFLNIADFVFVGGALANNFFKEQGKDVDGSLVSDGEFGLLELLKTGKVLLPEDTITKEGKILDAGPKTLEMLKEKIAASKLVLWNGPLGNYENGFTVATKELAKMIADAGHESIIGGGDTLAAIEELQLLDKFTFVSTGGGAMLDFLAMGTLPGIEALSKK